jgi:DNA helicase II / ATP-dependent DNA helicase PcrA
MSVHTNNHLNPEQADAVRTIEGPVLIIAGAGSGKTRVITYRIAHMLEQGIPQSSILALTFTNKAAREMRERIKGLLRKPLQKLVISTFHAFGVRILRQYAGRLGYRDNFSIYDQSDQISLIKTSARELQIDPNDLDLTKLSYSFSFVKSRRASAANLDSLSGRIFREYQDHLKLYNAVDFDDLIAIPLRLFEEHPDILEEVQNRYRYILVDEFQDTSALQYRVLHAMGSAHKNVCVVGDDDQSIYSWRGAHFENLLAFEKDFPGLKEIKLERNYRSTGTILDAANSVISHNKNRKPKSLWTGLGKSNHIVVTYPGNETEEALFIAEKIKELSFREKIAYKDFGVLMRTNGLSRTLEEVFLSENIPYRVSGGQSFFQRSEIKDMTAYMRVCANPDDDIALLRVLNTPRRGLGKKTLEVISGYATSTKTTILSALTQLYHATDSPLPSRARDDVGGFLELIERYRDSFFTKKNLARSLENLVGEIQYWGHLVMEHQKNDKIAKWKFRNIQLLQQSLNDFEHDPDNVDPSIFGYLNRISLITRDDQDPSDNGAVHLMTIHSAKGLEHDVVFVVGVEEGLIPHSRSLEESDDNLEEERRLFYVALTRAKKRLYLSSCRTRKTLRETYDCVPSRFLQEIPPDLLKTYEGEKVVDENEAVAFFADLRSRYGA